MAFGAHATLIVVASVASLSRADELAWGDVSADGLMEMRSLDVPVATARGAENLFIPNPMDSHDWSRTSVVRNSLNAELNGTSAKVKNLKEALRPIFSVMPKDAAGRVNNATARYALHRLFTQKHGWSIKGLEPAGASWQAGLSVTPDVKDIIKYMLPSYLQQLLSQRFGVAGFDLHSLATFAAVIEHMIHAEMISIVYSIFTTLELPVPGKKTGKELRDILDTFLMVFAFGINLDVSRLDDVQKTKAYLEKSHSGWHQLQGFAKEVEKSANMGSQLDFTEIVQLVEKMGEGYGHWQGKDCLRAKEELMAKPSHREGRVQLSEAKASHTTGRRSLFTENFEDLEKLGVLSGSGEAASELIIPNYLNSQTMCLSTASLYTVCCANECDNLLSRLEREVAAPAVDPAELKRLVSALPGPGIAEPLLQELSSLVDANSGLIALHGRPFAAWMHRAFPLECPAPSNHKITNPKTPHEWMGESGQEVKELEDMIAEIAEVLAKYTTMGKKAGPGDFKSDEMPASDASTDVVTIKSAPAPKESRGSMIGTFFRFAAMVSMLAVVAFAAKPLLTPLLQATSSKKDKLEPSFV